ncbi:helix-turn-helix domain-containing protein [Aquimarina sp. AU58]|uniref:helix-turn-helix domain-containing protein n=1 Tax=Aquimarina sp. AU58 TaxID=1874112 RepID=UPI000D659386
MKVIYCHKQKTLSQYINDLRIDFVVEKFRSDSKFRKYTIKAIAQEVGFNTAEAFSKTFYKKTGIYPSYFIKKLEE